QFRPILLLALVAPWPKDRIEHEIDRLYAESLAQWLKVYGGTPIDLALPVVLPPLVDLLDREAVCWIWPLKPQTLRAVPAQMHRLAVSPHPVVPFFLVPTRARFRLKLLEPLFLLLALPTIRSTFTVPVLVKLALLVLADFLGRGKLL